jgi:cellulose synthase/poly-beta-1,6-N-acetylglucosamine synthase-like glycosyltransferase
VTFVIVLTLSLLMFRPDPTPLGWTLSIVWSLPAYASMVSLQGTMLIRRRFRRRALMTPPAPVTLDFLIVVVPTIGRDDTYPALERSVRSYVEHLPAYFPYLGIDVVIEERCAARERIIALAQSLPKVRVIEVPADYQTPKGTRFKARANHYAHERRIANSEALENVWVLHMDDDTGVGPDTAAALAQFINRQRRAGPEGKHMAQGILTYPRENAVNRFTWLADAIRPADDIGRLRALTGMGNPVGGVHGELLLLRASIEAELGWDYGPRAIVEDAQFAMLFSQRYPGRSDWFEGRSYGASPASVRDFLKQRERWAWGLIALCFNRTIPRRFRALLALSVGTWLISPFQNVGIVLLVAWFTGSMNTSPVTESVLILWALNFGYAVGTYWEGLRVNVRASADSRRRWWELIAVVALIPLFAFIEGCGALRGLWKFLSRREQRFTVIAKPA